MKRLFLLSLVLLAGWQVSAQRPVIPAGSPGYMFTPPPTQEGVEMSDYMYGQRVYDSFFGTAYRPAHEILVYGVAVAVRDVERFPYLWVYMLQDRRVDTVNLCYTLDTVVAQLFCFIEQPPVSYADFRFISTDGLNDTVTIPFYEFYFTDPIPMSADVRFYVGISHSGFNVYNHWKKNQPYCPNRSYSGTVWYYRGNNYNTPQDPTCHSDGLDSTWGIWKYMRPGLVDWACETCTERPVDPGSSGNIQGSKYFSRSFFPIIRPPEDSTRIHPRHEHPLRAGAVEGLRLMELDSAHASFSWNTIPPSDWGPVGVNVNAYQVNYAPYGQDYDEADTVITDLDSCTVFASFDSTVMYKARCRARSKHRCDIHDTIVWGEWSREVYFHTGVGVPDTAPLVCQRVSGLRYEGVINEWPKFAWERCDGQDRFEVQYVAVGGDGWHRATVTSASEYLLRAEIDPTVRYWVRVRAQCEHHCHIHDTVMTGGWSDTVEFCLNPQGIGDIVATEGGLFSMAPNPARGTVTVKPSVAGEEYPAVLTVSDTKGREMMRYTLTDGSPLTIDVGALPSGAYLVTLTTSSRRTGTQRLVVEK